MPPVELVPGVELDAKLSALAERLWRPLDCRPDPAQRRVTVSESGAVVGHYSEVTPETFLERWATCELNVVSKVRVASGCTPRTLAAVRPSGEVAYHEQEGADPETPEERLFLEQKGGFPDAFGID